jgi:superfamily II DNA/RNA helicase
MKGQMEALGEEPDIVVATPGRLLDHIKRKPSA